MCEVILVFLLVDEKTKKTKSCEYKVRGLNPFRSCYELLKCPWARNWSSTRSINRRNTSLTFCLVTFISIGRCVPANTLLNPFSGKSRAFANNPPFIALVQDRHCSPSAVKTDETDPKKKKYAFSFTPLCSSVSLFFLFCFVKGLKL